MPSVYRENKPRDLNGIFLYKNLRIVKLLSNYKTINNLLTANWHPLNISQFLQFLNLKEYYNLKTLH